MQNSWRGLTNKIRKRPVSQQKRVGARHLPEEETANTNFLGVVLWLPLQCPSDAHKHLKPFKGAQRDGTTWRFTQNHLYPTPAPRPDSSVTRLVRDVNSYSYSEDSHSEGQFCSHYGNQDFVHSFIHSTNLGVPICVRNWGYEGMTPPGALSSVGDEGVKPYSPIRVPSQMEKITKERKT